MSKGELVAKGMDISARGIDLLNTLVETTNSPHSVVHLGIELGRWLGREKLSENQLQNCLERARGLVIANAQGNKFYEAVLVGTAKRAVGPLFVQPSGSLGRMMAKDPYLCWVTSTVACLFEFHGEDFISDVLCSFIMQNQMSKDGKPLKEYQLAWHPDRLQLKPVLDKIVSSIWYNIVNSGVVHSGSSGSPTSLQLPEELRDICSVGHNLESHNLGVVLSQIQEISGEIIMESEHVISNLSLWLIYHFKGRLRVTVSGKIIYDQILGPEKNEIELRANIFCDATRPCTSGLKPQKLRIFSSIGGTLKNIFSGNYDTQMTMEQSPRVRQKFYQPVKYPFGTAGKESIRTLTRQTAYEIVNWVLGLRLRRERSSNSLSFKIDFDEEQMVQDSEDLRIADLVARVPAIMNMGWNGLRAAAVVFSALPETQNSGSISGRDDLEDMDMDSGNDDSNESYDDSDESEATPEYILQYFPILRDLVAKARDSCRCHHCKRKKEVKLVPGCIQHTAFMEVMIYISQSVADSFGAEDCSASVTKELKDFGSMRILWEVVGGSMSYRAWLDTAARIVLGCPSIEELTDTEIDEDYTVKSDFMDARDLSGSIVAVQHGNLAVVCPWFDISQALEVKGSFGFSVVEGRLGIMKDSLQIHSLQGDSAVLETQHSDDVWNYAEKFPLPAEEIGSQVSIGVDKSSANIDYILVPQGSSRNKILMRVKSSSHSRFVDPSRAMIKVCQPEMKVFCKHKMTRSAKYQHDSPQLLLYSYDELLGRWPDSTKGNIGDAMHTPRVFGRDNDGGGSDGETQEDFAAGQYHRIALPGEGNADPGAITTLRVSYALDSHLKFNTALALTYDDVTILNPGTACLGCLIAQSKDLEALNGEENSDGNRWVICRQNNLECKVYGEEYEPMERRKRIKHTP